MNRVITWFEIPATNIERSAQFYEAVLGVRLIREEVAGVPHAIFPVEDFRTSVTGALVSRAPNQPGPAGTVIYLACDNVDECVRRAIGHGARVVTDAVDLATIGRIAALTDPDDNVFGLHSGAVATPS